MHVKGAFDPVQASRRLICEARSGALATLLPEGGPYASLVTVATRADGAPVLLLSRLARHTANILADSRVSLLIEERRGGDPMAGARISLIGNARADDDPAAHCRFLARHPEARGYAEFADFSFWRIEPARAHLVAGFGRIVDLEPREFMIDTADAASLLAAEEGAVAHMNEDHADVVELYATRLLGERPGPWRMIGLDPAGCDLMLGETVRRLDFLHRVTTPDALRKTLVDLARQARAALRLN